MQRKNNCGAEDTSDMSTVEFLYLRLGEILEEGTENL